MPQNRGQRGFILRHRQDARVDHDLAARQAEGIHLPVLDERHLPLKACARLSGRSGQTRGHPLDRGQFRSRLNRLSLRQNLLITLHPERSFLLLRHAHMALPSRLRVHELLGREILVSEKESGQE